MLRLSGKSIDAIRSLLGFVLVAAGVAVLAPAALAAPVNSISVIEGSTTSPSFSGTGTSGVAGEPVSGGRFAYAPSRIAITRGGAVVAEISARKPVLPEVPQVGDVVSLESPAGMPVASVTYDGLPSLNASVCAGSADFSGQRTAGVAVRGGAFTLKGTSSEGGFSVARISAASDSSFAGSFPHALTSSETVLASEEETSQLSEGRTFHYFSENERPVGACAAAPKPLALKGKLLRLTLPTIARLLKSGWLLHVLINQPGTVIQDLYLQNGKLPAHASKRKRAATLVARGETTLKHPGIAAVRIRVNSKGRRALKHAKHVKLVLITTLRSSSGVRINLGRRTISLKR